MLNSFPIALIIGTFLGFLSGLGTGGGSLLILWLTMMLGTEPGTARSINLMFFIPSALIACFFRWKQGSLNLKRIFPAIVVGCISAGVFSWICSIIDTGLFKKAFGILLIFTGIRELLYKNNTP